MTKRINILDSVIYNRIAAGEVVEKPASVVKELVENSLDASSTEIKIEIFGAGIENITVTDNGSGIFKEDFEAVFMPHATSKISKAEDLDEIFSFGFRGEAMASICSVAKVELTSKTSDDEIAHKATFKDGRMLEMTDIPSNDGTRVSVSNLFYNTPARAKFLKKEKTEENSVTQLVAKLILANPNVRISYFIDGKKKYSSLGLGLKSAIVSVYGDEFFNDLVEIKPINVSSLYNVNGYVSLPEKTKNNKNYQVISVNNRIIINQQISTALYKAYGVSLFKGQHPAAFLNIEVKADETDVNVTPNKSDVRFLKSDKVFSSVYSSVKTALDAIYEKKAVSFTNEIFGINDEDMFAQNAPNDKQSSFESSIDKEKEFSELKSFFDSSINYDKTYPNEKPDSVGSDFLVKSVLQSKESDYSVAESGGIYDELFLKQYQEQKSGKIEPNIPEEKIVRGYDFNILGIALGVYMIVENKDRLIFIDVHAANERLLYDKLVRQIDNGKVETQPLLLPYICPFYGEDFDYITSCFDDLRKIGFDIEIFKDNEIKVNGVPSCLTNVDISAFLQSVINEKNTKLSVLLKDRLAMTACKHSVRSGDRITKEQMEFMLQKFFLENEAPLQCPHGRPTMMILTKSDIEKKFRRS